MTASTTAPAAAAPLLEVRHVSKYFGSVIALKDVSAVVNRHQVTCVLGDNGAGKSTFIKILSGVHHHDEGEFLRPPHPAAEPPAKRRPSRLPHSRVDSMSTSMRP